MSSCYSKFIKLLDVPSNGNITTLETKTISAVVTVETFFQLKKMYWFKYFVPV